MCTAITYKTKDFYFGRTLDLEYSYNETVTVTPRMFPFNFREKGEIKAHCAIIGMATVADRYPLYYEAANEHGLAMAALNFPDNAYYFPKIEGMDNISPFEFIPWILSQCKNLTEVRKRLENINLCNINFSDAFPLSPLHWIIADKGGAIAVESTKDGLKIYENPIGVLTNNPSFDYHMTHLSEYMNITSEAFPKSRFASGLELTPYSRGMGAIGLPGDLSSASRFVRAAFVKLNSVSGENEDESVSRFFHILGTVEQVEGCVRMSDGSLEKTVYTSCINADKGIYYYTTYENRRISCVNMHKCDLDGDTLAVFPLVKTAQIYMQN